MNENTFLRKGQTRGCGAAGAVKARGRSLWGSRAKSPRQREEELHPVWVEASVEATPISDHRRTLSAATLQF